MSRRGVSDPDANANAAERTLDLQFNILRADETGKLLADAALRAADRKVWVRVLILILFPAGLRRCST